MKKFKVFVDFEEERYLREKAKQGYIFKKYTSFGFYHFIEGKPQNLNYRVDYRRFKKKGDFADYKALFEDAGWKHVYGTKNSYNQYFLPKDDNIKDDIFSSRESSAERYKRLYKICSINVTFAIVYFSVVLASNEFRLSNIGFLTPRLWEKTGGEFWSAFLFELPFVLFRILPVMMFLVMGTIYALWAQKAKKMYKQKLPGQF